MKHAVRYVNAVITNHSINSCDELHYRIKNSGVQSAKNLGEKISSSRKSRFLATQITISLQGTVFMAVIQPMWTVT